MSVVSLIIAENFKQNPAYCRKLQTELQDIKIQNFLRAYFRIFNEGLMAWMVRNIDDDYTEIDGQKNTVSQELAKFIIPTMHKNLGDGMMIVWEVPALDVLMQSQLTICIYGAVHEIAQRFYRQFRNLDAIELNAYSGDAANLEMAFGIAKGHTWRLNFGSTIDYAGSIINLASRLEGYARPDGIVAHYEVSCSLRSFSRCIRNFCRSRKLTHCGD